ncbi:MAG: type IV secretion system protein [Opitutaceae bacterium]|nr:type IV secretion system protein [Opitutaceae bacterium]
MLKLARLLGIVLGITTLGMVTPALAQVPVTDAGALTQLVAQLQQAQQEYQELVSQYNELKSTYAAVSQDVNPNQWATELDQSGMQNTVPNTSLLPNMLDGLSPPSQLGGNLGSLAQQYYGLNKVYIPTGTDFASTQTQQTANETANFEAIATQNLQSLEAREQDLPQIQSQLNSATTIQQVSSIQARLSAEQNYVEAQQAQAQNLQLLADEEQKQGDQAAVQENEQGAAQTISKLCSDATTLGSEPAICQGQ